jgi:hypothetical protein
MLRKLVKLLVDSESSPVIKTSPRPWNGGYTEGW